MEFSEDFECGEFTAAMKHRLMTKSCTVLQQLMSHDTAIIVSPLDKDKITTPLDQQQVQTLANERDSARTVLHQSSADKRTLEEAHMKVSDRLAQLHQQRQQLEITRKEFMLEIKNKFTAFISAKEYFKSKLNIYYTIEETPDANEMEVLVEFFKTKKSKSQNYSVTLHKSNDGRCKLIGMKPMLTIFDKLVQRLKETNDVPGFLCCIRYCFQRFASGSQHKFS